MGMEMAREKTMGLKREKTLGLKREKTVGIQREKTTFDRSRRRLTQSVIRNTDFSKDAFKVDRVFVGDMTIECPSTAKIVRIFTSSTFTDTMHERNKWMTDAYPRIKRFCQEKGYDFQVVDMRWGVRDEANDEHTATELCLKELKLCQKLSTGPNFVSLLSHKYGYRSLQRVIDAEEFETLLSAIEDDHSKEILNKWFQRDNNSVPPIYVLSPISKLIPDFLSADKEKKKAAKQQWWDEGDLMQEALEQAALKALGEENARNYVISVTEREVQMGMLEAEKPGVECIWIKRKINNIENIESSWQLSRYIECLGDDEKWQKPRRLMEELREKRMSKILPSENILHYSVNWTEKGIDPDFAEHKEYLSKMTEGFIDLMCSKIDSAITEHSKSHKVDPLYEECIEHTLFCQTKCENFYGREDTLQKIKEYIYGDSNNTLVVHGLSGSGKTSIVAKCAQLIPTWLKSGAAIMIRFIGTTPNSSNIASMLASLTKQIKLVYARDTKVPEELNELVQEFQRCLEYASQSHPLIIILDSLDQIDSSHNARQLTWLPTRLPAYVKFIVSTLEEEEYQCFQKLQTFVSNENMIAVPKLPADDVSGIVNKWLSNQRRCLTDVQMQILLKSFDSCPLPLYLKLSFDEACRWQSYASASDTVLQKTIRDSINSLYKRLEVSHGEKLVSRALGYLTAARNGLSESELEDILSCDEDVLNDVYMYWTPPLRRLPPLLLVRLRTDLQQYLVEREADGVRVMNWYHRQFIEAARARYCTKDKASFLHSQLADFFSGKWADGSKKPYTDKAGKSDSSDRHCVSQPLQFGDTYNIRKMNSLPFHRLYAGDLTKLKEECLCNFEFLQTKLAAISIREMVDDYDHARRIFPKDQQLNLIGDALQLSEDDMIYDPFMFPGQMLDRLAGEKDVADFLKQCESCTNLYLRPNQEVLVKPGGQLLVAMAGHRGPVRSLDLKKNGKVAVTCCEDGDDEIRTWDVQTCRMLRCYEELGTEPHFVSFINNDEHILIQFAGAIKVITEEGSIMYSIETPTPMYQLCVAGKGKSVIGIFTERTVELYDATNGRKIDSSKFTSDAITFGAEGINAGSDQFMVVTDTTQQHLAIFSLKSRSFVGAGQVMTSDADGEYMSIDALTISANEKQVYFTDSWTNDIRTLDIAKFEEVSVKKGSTDDYTLSYHVSHDGKKLYFSSHKEFVIMDLSSGKKEYLISHPCNITDVRTADLKKVVTITEDTCVRVWDVTKPVKEGDILKYCLGYNIWNMKTLPNPRYVAILFKRSEKQNNPDFSFGVYDVAKNRIVREAQLKESPSVLIVLDDKYAILNMGSRRLKIVDMDTMTVHSSFEGKINNQEDSGHVVKDGTGIVIRSRNQHNLKLYDIESGKTKTIFRGESSLCKISKFVCSQSGDLILAKVSDGPIIVYDITSNTKTVIHTKNLGVKDLGDKMCVSSSDHRVVVSGEKDVVCSGEKNREHVAFIWDSKKRCVIAELLDKEYFFKYMTKENRKGLSISVDDVMCVNGTDIVSAHDDYIMRVWDLMSGDLLHRLMGHSSNIEMYCIEEGNFFVTYGCWEEENALRLWDATSFTCVASFKLDHPIVRASICSDGRSFVTYTVNPARVVHWKLHGNEPMVDLFLEKETFEGELTVDLDLQDEADYDEDPGDIDSDFGDTDKEDVDDYDEEEDDDDDDYT
ncbi:hypothetical protein FSP39_016054 [Pinctada imbricata]|uniref:NACHT and WD repeat domain-containing protein 1 n=1 Tax=Pinctada imbricata TaxID=66713 RepID=A0AA88XKH2_PINIB|nr:hypothetical protein FSP39_016054 [Pinctada imbricata]